MNEFGERLKMLREKQGISLEELATRVDSTKSLLWRYEKGKSDPGLTAFANLAEYFGVTMDWLSGAGERDGIKVNKKAYTNAIDNCIDKKITPSELEQLIDMMKGR